MNIFFLDKDPVKAARMQCDKHVVKMVLETAQMLSTAARAQGHDVGYKSAYPKHPMTLWVNQSADNFRWAWLHGMSLAKEYTNRYDKIHKLQEPKNVNLPKVVVNSKKELIYISRSLVPGSKKTIKNKNYYKQVCIYAFNKKELSSFFSLKKKSEIEEMEDIEILRFFDLGIKIKMIKLNSNSVAVDEIKDVKKAEKILKSRKFN